MSAASRCFWRVAAEATSTGTGQAIAATGHGGRNRTTNRSWLELVRASRSVRVVGSGHSFNDALVSEGLTVSLDRLTGIVDIDPATRRVTVRGGTRLRDLTAALWDRGLALRFAGVP